MDFIPIVLAILDAVRPFLEDCLQPTSSGVARLRNYGPRIQAAVYRGAKTHALNSGLSRVDARKAGRLAVDEGREFAQTASDEELLATIQELHEICEDCGTGQGAAFNYRGAEPAAERRIQEPSPGRN